MSTGVAHAAAAARAPWFEVSSAAVLLAHDDIDTDQIIPARFLTTTQRAGLGRYCFHDWRYDEFGALRTHFVLNQPENVGRRILVAGSNFGCGSSREHAPWALLDAGFEAVVAGSFADIFRSNANRNGLLTVAIGEHIAVLHGWLRSTPDGLVTINLDAQCISWSTGQSKHFDVDAFTKHGLRTGLDELGMLLSELPVIRAWEAANTRERA